MANKIIVKGMKSRVIHAPSINFASSTTTVVVPVTKAPSPFTSAFFTHPGAAVFAPMHDHAGLREREREKRSDRIERDQPVSYTPEKNENTATEYCQHDNSVGVDQPPSAVAENVWQVIVLGDGAAEPRKIGEGGVRGQRQNNEDGADRQIVKGSFAKNRGCEHGEHALVAGLARIGGCDSIHLYEIRDSSEQHGQKKNDCGETALRVLDGRLAEGLYSVADSFYSGQSRAAASEHLEQKPVTDGFGHGRWRRKWNCRRGMSAADQNAKNAGDNSDEQCAHKQIRWHSESGTSLAHATKIEDSDYDQNAYAKGNHVRE
jgi:hypothetical protein